MWCDLFLGSVNVKTPGVVIRQPWSRCIAPDAPLAVEMHRARILNGDIAHLAGAFVMIRASLCESLFPCLCRVSCKARMYMLKRATAAFETQKSFWVLHPIADKVHEPQTLPEHIQTSSYHAGAF